ncbi:HAD-IA family hydrolase [Vibrio sp.]|nr:HAD-IA family hydrolase [Vibrio sp.]
MEKQWKFKGCLFDLDGTLIDSFAAAERAWTLIAMRNNLDVEHVLSVIHGRPAIESLTEVLEGQSHKTIQEEFDWLVQCETEDISDVVALNGSVAFLERLSALKVPWGIVTSGSYSVAKARFKALHMPEPSVFITAKDIIQGKPHPEPYLLGAKYLEIEPSECLVFEDAPSGVESGLASGASVIGIFSHYDRDDLFDVEGVVDLSQAQVTVGNDEFKFIITN